MALDMAWTSSEPVSEDDSLWDSRVESSTCIELSSIGSSVLSAAPYSTGRAGTIKPTHLTVSSFVWVPHERAVAMAMEVAGWGRCRRRRRLSRPSKKKLAHASW